MRIHPLRNVVKDCLRQAYLSRSKLFTTAVSNARENDKWHIVSGFVLERVPRLTTIDESWDVEFQNMIDEGNYRKNVKFPVELVENKTDASEAAEKPYFDPLPRITEDDKKGNVRSLDRCLDRSTYLILKVPTNTKVVKETGEWCFPMIQWNSDETIRETAERSLSTLCGSDLDCYFIGNAPIGHAVYEYPTPDKDNFRGTKIFFNHSVYLYGQVIIPKESSPILDYAWVTHDELKEYFKPDDVMYQLVKRMLYT